MSERVSIAGLDKEILLERLWRRAGSFVIPSTGVRLPTPPYDRAEAATALERGYVDYLDARLIKCDLSERDVDPRSYDAEYGIGTFAEVARSL